MLKLLFVALVLVLAGVALVGGSAAMPRGTNQFAPPPTPAPGELSFELTETELTDRLSHRLVGQSLGDTPLGAATLSRLTAQMRPNQVLASGDADVGQRSVPVSLVAHLDLEAGHPIVVVSDARAAGVPLPSATREAIRRAIQEQVDQEIARLGMRVNSVTITSGKLLVIGNHVR